MKSSIGTLLVAGTLAVGGPVFAGAELHVRPGGNDAGPGTAEAPLKTIQAAAVRAQPGDVITVHAGVYREWVNPPRGGDSEARRIVYQAAAGERVAIRGSEAVKGWVRVEGDLWKVTVPNGMFGAYNPYRVKIRGDWFDPRGREHHTGAVYLDGDWLTEAAKLEEVSPKAGKSPLWYGRVEGDETTLWAQFPGVDPNARLVEINVRKAVFYPDRPGRNYITLRGFVLSQAATQWAPPTAEQVGLVGTHWSKGWIIESNVVSHSVCSGIALGKYGDEWDNTSADTAEGYVKTIERALKNGWNRDTIGHHVVRNNEISHCEQAGLVGSLGAAFSTVTGNSIHDIHVRRLFSGAEMAGIKFHAAIDTVIRGNHVFRTVRGLWLDWMAQGTRVSGNLFHDNAAEDLFVEVDHGPFLVDNNLFFSGINLLDMSEGGAYAHNLFAGKLVSRPEPNRETPYHPAHTTVVAGLTTIRGGDNRYFNNLFVGPGSAAAGAGRGESRDAHHAAGYGLWVYDERPLPSRAEGNVYYNGARSGKDEAGAVTIAADPGVRLVSDAAGYRVRFAGGAGLVGVATRRVDTERLGKAKIPAVGYEQPDGSPLSIDVDYLGRKRDGMRPMPGPFEQPGTEPAEIPVGLGARGIATGNARRE